MCGAKVSQASYDAETVRARTSPGTRSSLASALADGRLLRRSRDAESLYTGSLSATEVDVDFVRSGVSPEEKQARLGVFRYSLVACTCLSLSTCGFGR